MSYLGSWKIDDLLTFPANTHRFDTGAATDADSPATYRIYEDETGTPILTGTMALLDSANTAGFYSEQITLSAANGFEKGKCYTIYITATVNSVAATTSKTFQIEAEVDANIVSDKTGYALSGTQTFNVTGNITGNLSGSVGSVTGAVGSVTGGVTVTTNSDKAGYSLATPQAFNLTGDITGNLSGSVGSVTGAVGSVTGGVTVTTNNDKTGYSLSVAGIQAIWDALTSALTTAGSIGKLLVDNINATISSRSTLSAAQVNTEVDTALADYDAPTSAELVTEINSVQSDITALNNLSAAQVKTQIVDALSVDTYAEPGQEAPPATTTLAVRLRYLYKALRNPKTQTATTLSLYNDAGTVVDQKATISDDGTTYTHGKIGTGP